MDDKDFIGHNFPQNCGDILKIIKKTNEKTTRGEYLYYGTFIKYPYELYVQKNIVLRGSVANPQIEKVEFMDKIWPQNCGDSLRIIRKTDVKDKWGKFFFEIEFLKYPCKLLAIKGVILKGEVVNPQIEQVEFVDKIWPQKCGDTLKIIRKTEQGFWECEFINYPYKVLSKKDKIQKGEVVNPQIEQDTFIKKIWPQNCGDDLKVLYKEEKKIGNEYLWKCEFLKYPCQIYAKKCHITNGYVDNPNLPYKKEKDLLLFIKKNFKYKPILKELAEKLELSVSKVGKAINEFNLRSYISYYENYEEKTLRDFISQYATCEQEEYYISDKNKKFFGIDVYIPNKKLGFEFNGTYWHSELFKESNYHQIKSLVAQEQNINLIHIFEYEWENVLKRPIIESLIKSKLGIFDKKIGASKCKVKEIDKEIYQKFCDENHLQGYTSAKIKLGLFYKDELVQVMSFDSPRFTDKYEWEIIRECSKLDIIVIGGKEKLWSYFVKVYNPNSVISYCDFAKFNGNSYLKLDFKKERLNKPGFVWYDEKNRNVYWRNPYKHNEYKEKYLKIYDCGQLVFTWKKINKI